MYQRWLFFPLLSVIALCSCKPFLSLEKARRSLDRQGPLIFDRCEEAAAAFRAALAKDPGCLPARINLGGVHFSKKDFPAALAEYEAAGKALEAEGGASPELAARLYLCLSKARLASGDSAAAREYFGKAQNLDPQQAGEHLYLAGSWGSPSSARAGEADSRALFVDEP